MLGLAWCHVLGAVEVPPRDPAPNDESAYRRLELPNGLRVLLLSDPKLNKSSASLVVSVGQINDPVERPGLAHFLEHMLFLGTEKYPDEAEYGNYINSNGGGSNAYTASDHTNYHFEIRHDAFEGAIDRFSQFFIAPLFTPEFTDREINAVNNEAQRYFENDFRRNLQVRRELYAPGSGEAKFSTGNLDTLTGVTQAELLSFYRAHYSADHMALALTGKASLDQLEAWAREYFEAIPDRDLATQRYPNEFLPSKPAVRIAQIEPVKDVREIRLEFPIPDVREQFASKPGMLLSSILGYEGKGSLLSYLKEQGLATGLGASTWERTPTYGSMWITVSLTPKGLAVYDEVLEAVFAQLEMLRASPYPQTYFAEQAALARFDERFRDKGDGIDLAVNLANQALFFPLELAEREPFLWLEPDPKPYFHLLDALKPENVLITLTAKGVPTDRSEKYYDVKYSYEERSGPLLQQLGHPQMISALALPEPNPFVPESADLIAERPVKLIDESTMTLYYSQDTTFDRPMSAYLFRLVPPKAALDLEASVLIQFYNLCINEMINEVAYDAQLAGVSYTLAANLEGVAITVSGYSDSAAKFFDYLVPRLKTITLDEERFDGLKDRLLRGLRSWPKSETYELASARRNALRSEIAYLPDAQLPVAEKVTLAQVQAFAGKILSSGKLQGLVHGNLDQEDALRAARSLAGELNLKALPDAKLAEPRFLQLAPGTKVVDADKVEGNNSCFWQEYVFAGDSPIERATAMIISNYLNEPFYSEMRTRQQLGYIVWGGASSGGQQLYCYFVIQSGEHAPDVLQQRAESFIKTVPEQFAAIESEAFATLVAGAEATLKEKPKSIAENAGRLFAQAFTYEGDWGRRTETLAALRSLTAADVAAQLNRVLSPDTARQRSILLVGREHQTVEPLESTFTDRDAWKAKQVYQ